MLIIMKCRGVPRPLGSQGTAPAGEKEHNNGTATAPGAKPGKNTTTAPRRRPRRTDPKDLRRTPAHSDVSMMIIKTTLNTNRKKNIHVHAPTCLTFNNCFAVSSNLNVALARHHVKRAGGVRCQLSRARLFMEKPCYRDTVGFSAPPHPE